MGSLLCTYWNLPEFVKIACENHTIESLQKAKEHNKTSDFTKMLSLASLMTMMSRKPLNHEVTKEILGSVDLFINNLF